MKMNEKEFFKILAECGMPAMRYPDILNLISCMYMYESEKYEEGSPLHNLYKEGSDNLYHALKKRGMYSYDK